MSLLDSAISKLYCGVGIVDTGPNLGSRKKCIVLQRMEKLASEDSYGAGYIYR